MHLPYQRNMHSRVPDREMPTEGRGMDPSSGKGTMCETETHKPPDRPETLTPASTGAAPNQKGGLLSLGWSHHWRTVRKAGQL